MAVLEHLFVVPAADGSPTGGNLYNDALLAHLPTELAAGVERLEVAEACQRLAQAAPRVLWIDSLFLGAVPRLCAALEASAGPDARRSARVVLLAHYLPSWVEHGDGLQAAQLSDVERRAIDAVDAALVTSTTMAALLRRLRPGLVTLVAEPPRCCAETQPGAQVSQVEAQSLVRALFVGNLTVGKGLRELLAALDARLGSDERLQLSVIGREDIDPLYARACRERIQASTRLSRCVELLGALPHERVLETYVRAEIFVSASRIESYGMAVAEAKVAGLIVLARRGGHVAELLGESSGGALFEDVEALVEELLALVRVPTRRADKLAEARRARLAPRSAPELAREVACFARKLGQQG